MPGLNHTIEANFLDALSQNLRPAAMELLRDYRLRQMLDMLLDGPTSSIEQRYELDPTQWQELLEAVILTKVTYFEINPGMQHQHLKILIEIASYCLHQPHASISQLIEFTKKETPYMAEWLQHAQRIQRQWQKSA
ncbi:hypothetical protein [Thiomicrospira sp. WB1]|uniref:hypothetical protein n=1 Tax=Thiomicrospira sp. WB1 TaxID=1685380 RepID=UPI000748CADD|nr:hypothetical protein [Thiomicrospira sp. WB1]KUJ72797.1 hypothetical protein AVO41_03165 [Thiomicrospira sp. WB1]